MAQHAHGYADNRAAFEDAGQATRAIHVGFPPDIDTGSVVPPVHMTSTYIQDGIGHGRHGYEYARMSNPTRDALQVSLASLEGGASAFSFSSGPVTRCSREPTSTVALTGSSRTFGVRGA